MIESGITNKVFEGVIKCISKSTGLDVHEVLLEKTLIGDLKIDSIDMMDLLFELEDEFNISVKLGEFEAKARGLVVNEPFEVNNIITPAGLKVLKELLPEAAVEKFSSNLMVQQIPYLFTVKSICNLVEAKLADQKSVASKATLVNPPTL